VCTGPLTNLAHAAQQTPDIVRAVREVVLMGGVLRPPGNVTPVAEFNIYADPLAAAVVFAQHWPLTMVGLDVTNQVLLSRAERDALSDRDSPEAVLVREVTRHLFDVRGVDTMALHDPLAVGVAIRPELVTTSWRDVAVETEGELTLGQTIVDLRPSAPPPERRTRVCERVDAARFKKLFFETLGLY
jgi:purine nucleosidase